MLPLGDLVAFFMLGGVVGGLIAFFFGKKPEPKGIEIKRSSVKSVPLELRAAFEAPIDGAAVLKGLVDRGIIEVKDRGESE